MRQVWQTERQTDRTMSHPAPTRGKTALFQNKSSAVAEMGDRARAKWAEMWGLLCPFPCEELGPHLTQCRLGRGLPPYQVASWSIQPFGHNTPTLQTDRQTGQRSRSIGRTITCNGRPKTLSCKNDKTTIARLWLKRNNNYISSLFTMFIA